MKAWVGRRGLVVGLGFGVMALGLRTEAEETGCAVDNGDVNGDQAGAAGRDVTDAIYLLSFLFLGGPRPVQFCSTDAQIRHLQGALDACQEDLAACEADLRGTQTNLEIFESLLARSRMARLPATGAEECSDAQGQVLAACPPPGVKAGGQDGYYRSGCPVTGRFVDNGDGTVTDTCTGLMWQKRTAEPVKGGVHDPDGNGWLDWEQALDYCAALGDVPGIDPTFGGAGHTDWRLPNVRELQSLIDFSRRSPAVPPPFQIRSDPGAEPMWYASSTPGVIDDVSRRYFWMVSLAYGSVDVALKTNQPYVLAVRSVAGTDIVPATGQTSCFDQDGGAPVPCGNRETPRANWPRQDAEWQGGCPLEGRFVDMGDGTVADTCTGLMWQKRTARPVEATNGYTTTWEKALGYCADLGKLPVDIAGFDGAGYCDWRLPNVKELQSILQFGPGYPAVVGAFTEDPGDPAMFHIGPSTATDPSTYRYFWTSTTLEVSSQTGTGGHPEYAYSADLSYGTTVMKPKTDLLYILAVRGPGGERSSGPGGEPCSSAR